MSYSSIIYQQSIEAVNKSNGASFFKVTLLGWIIDPLLGFTR